MHEFRISRYQPGVAQSPTSTWTSKSDVGETFDDGLLTNEEYERVERLYLEALRLMMSDTGVSRLKVFDVKVSPIASAAARQVVEGAYVSPDEAIEICRLELREELSCRLEDDGRFYAHVGFEFYLYVGSVVPCDEAVAEIKKLLLFVEDGVPSPYTTA